MPRPLTDFQITSRGPPLDDAAALHGRTGATDSRLSTSASCVLISDFFTAPKDIPLDDAAASHGRTDGRREWRRRIDGRELALTQELSHCLKPLFVRNVGGESGWKDRRRGVGVKDPPRVSRDPPGLFVRTPGRRDAEDHKPSLCISVFLYGSNLPKRVAEAEVSVSISQAEPYPNWVAGAPLPPLYSSSCTDSRAVNGAPNLLGRSKPTSTTSAMNNLDCSASYGHGDYGNTVNYLEMHMVGRSAKVLGRPCIVRYMHCCEGENAQVWSQTVPEGLNVPPRPPLWPPP
ncbi:hypothetical protein B0H13DRAFT_2502689 [Mycena leptocephala]|nr:hypothetical protein B0H13DRAFT_2502689 [Mycena leptocephala]